MKKSIPYMSFHKIYRVEAGGLRKFQLHLKIMIFANILRNLGQFRENLIFCQLLLKGVLHPRPVFGLFLHFSQKLQHIGNK